MTGPQYVRDKYGGFIDSEEIRDMVTVALHELGSLNVNLYQIRVHLEQIAQNTARSP